MKKVYAFLPMVALLVGTSVQAGPTLMFNGMGVNGTVSYAGGSAPLVGSGIGITDIASGTGFDATPLNSTNPLSVVNGALSFTTGNYVGYDPSVSGSLLFDQAGGTISLMGEVPGTTPPLGPPPQALLFNGVFTGLTRVNNVALGLEVVTSVHLTQINTVLADYFGLPSGATEYTGGLTITFNKAGGNAQDGVAFTSNGLISLANDTISPVPEPATLGMACTAAFAGIFYGLRRARRSSKDAANRLAA